MADFCEQLKGLPKYCRLIPLGFRDFQTGEINYKRPIENNWRNKTYSLEEVDEIKKTGIGIVLGKKGNGVLCLDFDGPKSFANFKDKFGFGIEDLPPTIAWTSGTPNRHQRAFIVPESEWSRICHHDKIPELEIRWTGQSVLVGRHPSGRDYQFLKGCSPRERDIAQAPEMLIAAIEKLNAPINPIPVTTKSTDNFDERALKIHNIRRLKTGLNEWFITKEYFAEPIWRKIGICIKQLGHDDWGDEHKFFDLFHDWSERDPRKGPKTGYQGFEDVADKWEKIEIRSGPNAVTFSSFIQIALDDGFLTLDDLTDLEKEQVKPKPTEDPIETIEGIIKDLYELEKEASDNSWSERQYLRSRLGGYRISKEEVDDKLTTMFANEAGIQIGEGGNSERRHRSLVSTLSDKELLTPLLPSFLLKGRDALLVGQAGSGKTLAALGISYAVATGHENLFHTKEGVPPHLQGATLYLGTDGASGAIGMIKKYSQMLKVPDFNEWDKKFTFVGEDEDKGTPAWKFTISELYRLVQLLEKGHPKSGVPYRLLVIDSLKAVLELAKINFGIGPMGTIMRLMQGIASKYEVSILWLHHTRAGAKVQDLGMAASGGNSNIIQIPYAIHLFHTVEKAGYDHVTRWTIDKYRGDDRGAKTFDFTLDKNNGLFEIVKPDEIEDKLAGILYEIWIRQDAGASTPEIADGVKRDPKTAANNLTEFHKQKLIQNTKRRWFLTKAGLKRLAIEWPTTKEEIDTFLLGEGKSVR